MPTQANANAGLRHSTGPSSHGPSLGRKVHEVVHPAERGLRIWRGRLRMAAWDYLRATSRPACELEQLHSETGYPFANLPRNFDDPGIDSVFDSFRGEQRFSYAYRAAGDLVVEPKYGYVIAANRFLIHESLPYSEITRQPEMQQYFIGYPPLWQHFAGRKSVISVPRAISLREPFEHNYWHMFNDVLSKIAVLERLGVSKDIPLIVGEPLARQGFFQGLVAMWPGLADRLIYQGDNYVKADEIYFCRALSHTRANLDHTLDHLDAPRADPKADRRIFLNRAVGRIRRLTNEPDVVEVVSRLGFECVDTEQLSLAEQQALFSSASCVVGIHGAGLVNVLYRRGAPLRLLELFPADVFRPTYAWMAEAYGFRYDAIQGTADKRDLRDHNFAVDPGRLRAKLESLLSTPC